MRFLSKIVPDVVVDAAIVGSLVVGAVLVTPKIIYSMLMKDGVFNDN